MTTAKNRPDWESFYINFKNSEIGSELAKTIPQKILRQLISPVLSLKYAIEQWELLDETTNKLTIGWLGAELPDLADSGRWFSLLPTLLDRQLTIRMIFQDAKAKPYPSPNPKALDHLPEIETTFDGTVSEADLIVVSHPDFVTKRKPDDVFAGCGSKPMLALFWSALDTSMEGAWFEHKGLETTDLLTNPFAIENNVDAAASWGRFIGRLQSRNVEPRIDWYELMDLGYVRHHSGLSGYGHPTGQPGKLRKDFSLRNQKNAPGFLYVLDNLYLNTHNHWLYEFDPDDRELTPVFEVDQSLIDEAPGPGVDILKAYQWAAKIKLGYRLTPLETETASKQYQDWLSEACRRDNPYANLAYARWLEAGYVDDPNLDFAFLQYRKAADQGLASAQYIVADMAFHDLKDRELAQTYFKQAAEQGYSMAAFNLGLMHLEGMIPGANPAEGVQYLEQAAKTGETNSLCYLGEWLANQGKLAEAMPYWFEAADQGSVEAASQVLGHADAWHNQLPEKERRGFKKRVRNYSQMLRKHRAQG